MKVCILGNDLNLHSGHSKPAFDLTDALAAGGHQVVVVTRKANESAVRSRLRGKSDKVAIETPFENRIEEVRSNANKGQALARALKDAEIVHVFDYVDPEAVRRALKWRIPIVYTANNFRWSLSDVIAGGFGGLLNLTRLDFDRALLAPDRLFRKAFDEFDAILCTSGFVQSAFVRIGVDAHRVYRVSPWLSEPHIEASSNDVQAKPDDFLYYGWGSNIRGVSDLLKAFRQLRTDHSEVTLGLHFTGGHGLEERLLSNRIASIRDASVKLHGFDPAILNTVNRARCVVLPFRASFGYAQPPRTIMESMALGKAVISTVVASVPEVVSHMRTGMLVPPRYPEQLAGAMAQMIEDEGLAGALGSRAHKHFKENHDVERVVPEIERTYLRILGGG